MMQEQVMAGMLGMAVGDALGVPVEFCRRDELQLEPVTDMRAYGTHHQPAGTWSDDTSMALCTIASIAETGTMDYHDLADRFVRWKNEAYLTATGVRFDIGGACARALNNYERSNNPFRCGVYGEYDAGNGSLMRILPLAYWLDRRYGESFILNAEARTIITKVSGITHAHIRCVIACGLYLAVAQELLRGVPKEAAVSAGLEKGRAAYRAINEDWADEVDENYAYTADELKQLGEDKIKSSGYVVDTLRAALWCLLTTERYSDCVLKAVNLGDDTDTTAAVAGGLAGLVYGVGAIPPSWLDALQQRELIVEQCEGFSRRLSQV